MRSFLQRATLALGCCMLVAACSDDETTDPGASVASVTLTNAPAALAAGVQATITATPRDADGDALTGRTITWTTSNESIVTVSQSGLIEAVALGGPVDITATSEGKTATVQVSVVPRYGYVFANVANAAAPYEGNALSSYNTVGAPSTITRASTGSYSVRFRNMAAGTRPVAALASAFGAGNATCMSTGQSDNGADLVVAVECRTSVNALSDEQFTLTVFGSDAFPGRFGFAIADQETSAGYAAAAGKSFNAAGQPVQITRTSAGNYQVVFTGNTRSDNATPAETFHVSAADPSGNTRCEVVNWDYSSGSVNVRCAEVGGTAVDGKFVIVMLEAGRVGQRHALAWANCGAVSCTPSPTYARSTGGDIAVTRVSTGRYDVVFSGLRRVTGADNVLVTSYASNGGFCKVVAVDNTGANDLVATLQCFGPGASLADRFFTVALVP